MIAMARSGYHQVEPGEYLASIAHKYGFTDWHKIYNHPNNADFRKKRPNPNVINPGDRIFIPEHDNPRIESCPTDKRHKFQMQQPQIWLRVVLADDDDKPYANLPYRFSVPGESKPRTDNTNKDGMLEQRIPATADTVDLVLPSVGLGWKLRVGDLDPVHDEDNASHAIIKGVQGRLHNLGYKCGPIDGILGPKTRAALQEFQSDVMKIKEPSGEPDLDTRNALKKEHGC
jgi:N-acetylmuramoyl-L-alanine amidase